MALIIALSMALLAGPTAIANATTRAVLQIRPVSGPPGTRIEIKGFGFYPTGRCDYIIVNFTDANGIGTFLGSTGPDPQGNFRATAQIPSGAAQGEGTIFAQLHQFSHQIMRCIGSTSASTAFTVTPLNLQPQGGERAGATRK